MKTPCSVSGIMTFLFVILGLVGPSAAFAASSPSLGTASTYSILSGTTVTNTGATTVSGDVGIYPGAGTAPNVTGWGTVTLGGTLHDTDTAAANAQTDKNTAYGALAAQGCITTYAGTKDLAGLNLVPGVYCADSFHLTGTLTLTGSASDVWVFKSASDLVMTGGTAVKVVFSGGAVPCNVWWRVVSSATFDPGSSLAGNILADTSITFATGSSLNGRALARTAAVTLDAASITGPTCSTTPVPESTATISSNTITVIKQVINDNGGKAIYSDFPLFVNGTPVASGESVRAIPGMYTVTEMNRAGYASSFTGNCNASGVIDHGGINTHDDVCTVVNNDIGAPPVVVAPPLIDVVKVPSPLALPAGPGSVIYTYTVKNIGTVPMTGVTLVGDVCSPIILDSGDTNHDTKLDVNETWVYRCTASLTQTTKNTVVATGHANGLTAIDVASATVIVGVPIVPPLIHITKVPNPLALPAGTGTVVYTNEVSNPGTVALSSVHVSDDKCDAVTFISGDTNKNTLLDVNETWTYTCQATLTQTTTNTVIATGIANGLTATDFALATVVVAVPKLPNTGVDPGANSFPLAAAVSVGLLAIGAAIVAIRSKRSA
ncbi:MAG: ice-binding family protein [Candidatus Magasanikbacteria bacterium]|nr:ice-binding family protein [Candidatus Magasanikbacteria bacterium]